jgi:hypothetical protein
MAWRMSGKGWAVKNVVCNMWYVVSNKEEMINPGAVIFIINLVFHKIKIDFNPSVV